MERIRALNRYQKGILLLLIAMMVVFGVTYFRVSSRVGFCYQDEILVPVQDQGTTVYSGKIKGQNAAFTVTQEGTVSFQYGEKLYGPYTVTEDPEAVPKEDSRADQMTGVEILDGNKVLFRGGILYTGADRSDFYLYTEEGWYSGLTITATMSDGTVVDGHGNIVDTMEPSVWTILNLVNGPVLESKGEWLGYWGGVLLSVLTAAAILFADELFRWKFVFQVRDVDQIEPSDWAMMERYIGWTIGAVGALVIYIMGLQ